MKKLIFSLLVVTAFVAAPVSLFAQTPLSSTLSSKAKASIVSSIAVSNETSGAATGDAAYLDFGSITKGTAAGSVTIAPDGTVASSAVTLITSSRNPASFKVTGSKGADFSVTLPATITLNGTGDGAPTMTVNTVTSESPSYVIDATGTKYFHVGGTLVVPETQADDTYSGTFNVIVAYN